MNPYQPPKSQSEEPRRATRQEIIDGKTTAGPLAILYVKHPKKFIAVMLILIFVCMIVIRNLI